MIPRMMVQSGRRITWKRIKVYVVRYRSKRGDEVLVKTLTPPKKTRIFRVARNPGRLKFKAVAASTINQEVLIVAKATKSKKGKKKEEEILDEEALEELDDIEDLDDVEDEDEDEEETEEEDEDEDDDEEEEDEEPDEEDEDDDEEEVAATKKKAKKKAKKARDDGKVGSAEIAEAAGISPRELRMVLRKHEVAKNPETNRYEWDSLEHKAVKKILKLIAAGEHKKIRDESLGKLKEKKAAEAEEKKAKKPSTKKKKKKKS